MAVGCLDASHPGNLASADLVLHVRMHDVGTLGASLNTFIFSSDGCFLCGDKGVKSNKTWPGPRMATD